MSLSQWGWMGRVYLHPWKALAYCALTVVGIPCACVALVAIPFWLPLCLVAWLMEKCKP